MIEARDSADVKVVNCLTSRDSESVPAGAPACDVKWALAEAGEWDSAEAWV